MPDVYQSTDNSGNVTAGNSGNVQVFCPSGYKFTGAGWHLGGSASSSEWKNLHILSSESSSDGRTWTLSFENGTTGTMNVTLTGYYVAV
jgi:hypothetical protein